MRSVHFALFSAALSLLVLCPRPGGAQDAPIPTKEIATLIGHKAMVGCVAFSHDGRMLASGDSDKKIRLWDVASGKNTRTLLGHTQSWVKLVAFAPDNKVLVSHGDDSSVRVWDVNTGAAIRTLEPCDCVQLAFGSDGAVLFSLASVRRWNWKEDTRETLFQPPLPTNGAGVYFGFSPEGKLRAAAGREAPANSPAIFSVPEGKAGKLDNRGYVPFGNPFSPGAKTFVTGVNSPHLFVWDCPTASLLYKVVLPDRAGQLAFSPDGALIAVSYRVILPGPVQEGNIILLSTANGKEITRIQAHRAKFANISGLAFSPDGNTLASSSIDETIKLFDVSAAKKAAAAKGKGTEK